MNDDYLARPLIESVSYEISDTRIAIQSPNTCFVDYTLPRRWRKDELLCLYQSVLHTAKARGTKISYSLHIRKTLLEKWSEYEAACTERERLFSQLRDWTLCVQRRGIHMGHSDDEYLGSIYKINAQLMAYGYGGSITACIAHCYHVLSQLKQSLSHDGERFDRIAL